MSPIGLLNRATSRQLSVGLNQAGEVSFSLSIYDRMADPIQPLSTCIVVYRNGTAIWSGPVLSVEEDGPSASLRVTAKGWFHLLENRIMRMTTPADPTSSMLNPTFASNANNWRLMFTPASATIARDTGVFDTSPASLNGSQTGSALLQFQGEFTGTSPAPGQELQLSFRYRFAHAGGQAALDKYGLTPSIGRMFGLGSPADGDVATAVFPLGSLTIDTWYTGNISWTPYKTGLSWSAGTGTPTRYRTGTNNAGGIYTLPGAAFRVWFPYDTNAGSASIYIDSCIFTPKSLPIIQKTYSATQACTIVSGIISDINGDASSGITVGLAPSTATRTRTYKKYDNVGRAIQELSDIENGFDWTINPLTKVLDMYASRGSARPNVHFGYRSGPDNLVAIRRTIDGTGVTNYVIATGKYGSGISSDSSSISQYGTFEDVVSIGDFASSDYSSTLLAVSGAEVLLRKQPRQIYAIVPKPGNYSSGLSGDLTPEPFVDYNLGDTIYFSGKVGRLNVEAQAVRVFGLNVSIDDNGAERINEIKVVYR